MPKKLLNFAAQQGLPFSDAQAEQLLAYGRCVWAKKDTLNLTSVADFDEVITRHLCDGLAAAACIYKQNRPCTELADAGAGCGYIGFALAAAFPQAQITLLESLEKRCQFMNWAALKAAFANIRVQNVRLGQAATGPFDVVTERAMGPLETVLPLCTAPLKAGGIFIAFQSEITPAVCAGVRVLTPYTYTLPGEAKPRYLAVYQKDENIG